MTNKVNRLLLANQGKLAHLLRLRLAKLGEAGWGGAGRGLVGGMGSLYPYWCLQVLKCMHMRLQMRKCMHMWLLCCLSVSTSQSALVSDRNVSWVSRAGACGVGRG